MPAQTLVVIAGPTAIGKTSISISIAKQYNCSILSADSRQFYKELNIGTAKPSEEEIQGVQHYFINSHSVSEDYNVGKYETDAIELLDKLFLKEDAVLLVGGSGLYIDAVCKGFDNLPEADLVVRNKINKLFEEKGIEGLQSLLRELDENYFYQVDIQNPQRISRALEVCLTTGKPYSAFREGKIKKRNFNIIKIGLNTNREALYAAINLRVDKMMANGLLEEVKQLQNFKCSNSLQTVGYKELFDYLDGKTELNTAIDLIKQNTRRYAKRQLTWFRRDTEIKWFQPHELQSIFNYLESEISKFKIQQC